jgi:peptidoglycan hydrolase-like protein with peptidoglycan-binding domain
MNNVWINQNIDPYFDNNIYFNSHQRTGSTTLHLGSKGMHVKEIQTCLKRLGYYTGNIDGIFGTQTKQAVERFQREQGLVVDGIVGTKTRAALKQSCPTKKTTNGQSMLHLGSQGDSVRMLQTQLQQLGYYTGNSSGNFDSQTREAVESFQREHGLIVDGIVGVNTWNAIDQAMAVQVEPIGNTNSLNMQPSLGPSMENSGTMALNQAEFIFTPTNEAMNYETILKTPEMNNNSMQPMYPMPSNQTSTGVNNNSMGNMHEQPNVTMCPMSNNPSSMPMYNNTFNNQRYPLGYNRGVMYAPNVMFNEPFSYDYGNDSYLQALLHNHNY